MVARWIGSGYQCVMDVLDEGNTVKKLDVPKVGGGEVLSEFFREFSELDYNVLVYYDKLSLSNQLVCRLAISYAKLFSVLARFRDDNDTKLHIRIKKRWYENVYSYHLPALVALNYSPYAVSWASKDVRTILVTGTNGKTTVTKMIYGGLLASGIPAICNKNGANMPGGVFTPFVKNIRHGKPKAKWAVIECDERHMMETAPILRPETIVVTNISTDQTSRLHSVTSVKRYIERSILDSNPRYVVCSEQLNLDIAGSDTAIARFSPSKQYHSVIPGRHNILNVAAAITCLKLAGLDSETARAAVFNTTAPPGRFDRFKIDGKDVSLILAKNPVGLSIALEYAAGLGKINLVLAMNNFKGDDENPDWLTDESVAEELKTCPDARQYFGGSLGDLLAQHYSGTHIQDSGIIPMIQGNDFPTVIIANYTALYGIRSILFSASSQKKERRLSRFPLFKSCRLRKR